MSALKRAWNKLLLKEPSWTEEEYKEAKLKRKLDIFFLSFICLSSFCKGLDQGNIKNAYVSGMQEDLHIVGNQYNLFTTFFNIGYMVVIPLSQYLMVKRIRPSLLMPCAELLWGIATGCLASVSNYRQVYGLRFLLGFAEGTAWPASVTLLTAWYGPKEIGKRLAAYEIAAYGSGMFSGFLQAGLYTNLNGAHGLAGWKWLFIVNAAITVVVAGWGFYACPDYPSRPNPWATWLDEEDVAVAQRRMARINRAQPKGWSLDTFKFVFGRPEHWAMYFYGWFANQSHYGTNYFNLWLKALKNSSGTARYSVQQLNYIPVAGSAATVVGEFIFMPLCDYVGRAWPIQLPLSTIDVVFCAIMAAWKVPDGAKFASFIWLDLTQVYQHLTVAWWAELMNESAEGRAFIIGLQTSITYAVGAGLPLAVWPASQAPVYALGWKFAVGMAVASVLCILATVWLQHRRARLNRYNIEVASPVAEYIDEKGTPSAEEGTTMPALAPVESHIVPALRASQIESGTI